MHSADVPVEVVPSSEISVIMGGDADEISTELENCKAHIAELESVETVTVRRQEELMEKAKQRHAEEVNVWKETSLEDADSLVNDVKVPNANSVKMAVKWNEFWPVLRSMCDLS